MRPPAVLAVAAAWAGSVAACGGYQPAAGSPSRTPLVDERPATAGTPLLALLPAGADVVVELDLARLRANPTVGPVLAAVPRRSAAGSTSGVAALGPLGSADL